MTKITSNPLILKNKDLNFVDMHHHSTVSDGNKTPEFLAKVYIKNKIGLCIADHNQIKGSVYLAKQKKLFSIPAIEITSKEAKDILVYFYSSNDLISFWEKEVKKNIRNNALFNLNRTSISAIELPDKIKKYNGIPVLAHPFAMKPKYSYNLLLDNNFLKKVKGIELFTFEEIKQEQARILEKFNKPLIAGSDSHTSLSTDVLTGSSYFEKDSFLDSILKRRNIIYYNKYSLFKRIAQKLVILKNNIHLEAPAND